MASEKQLKQWIRSRFEKMQSDKLSAQQREYFQDTLAKATSKMFENVVSFSKKGNLIVSRKKGHKQELEHLWNILKKEKIPSKLSQRAIIKKQEKRLFESTMDFLYKNFSETEIKNFLPERNEKGQFSEEDYQNLVHWQEQHSLLETQNLIDEEWEDLDDFELFT